MRSLILQPSLCDSFLSKVVLLACPTLFCSRGGPCSLSTPFLTGSGLPFLPCGVVHHVLSAVHPVRHSPSFSAWSVLSPVSCVRVPLGFFLAGTLPVRVGRLDGLLCRVGLEQRQLSSPHVSGRRPLGARVRLVPMLLRVRDSRPLRRHRVKQRNPGQPHWPLTLVPERTSWRRSVSERSIRIFTLLNLRDPTMRIKYLLSRSSRHPRCLAGNGLPFSARTSERDSIHFLRQGR